VVLHVGLLEDNKNALVLKQGADDWDITAEITKKSQHTDVNKDPTNKQKVLVWPVATYGYESWKLRKHEETRLDAFETNGLRKILRVSWTAKKTN